MANPGDINLKLLSECTDGLPIVVAGTTAAAPTPVHKHPGGEAEIDLVSIWLCNTHATDTMLVGVVAYTGTPADPTNVIWKGDIPAKSGSWVALSGKPITDGKWIGVFCATASVITADGKVGRSTL